MIPLPTYRVVLQRLEPATEVLLITAPTAAAAQTQALACAEPPVPGATPWHVIACTDADAAPAARPPASRRRRRSRRHAGARPPTAAAPPAAASSPPTARR